MRSFVLIIPECSLTYEKLVQTNGITKQMRSFVLIIPECSLTYEKLVQKFG